MGEAPLQSVKNQNTKPPKVRNLTTAPPLAHLVLGVVSKSHAQQSRSQ